MTVKLMELLIKEFFCRDCFYAEYDELFFLFDFLSGSESLIIEAFFDTFVFYLVVNG